MTTTNPNANLCAVEPVVWLYNAYGRMVQTKSSLAYYSHTKCYSDLELYESPAGAHLNNKPKLYNHHGLLGDASVLYNNPAGILMDWYDEWSGQYTFQDRSIYGKTMFEEDGWHLAEPTEWPNSMVWLPTSNYREATCIWHYCPQTRWRRELSVEEIMHRKCEHCWQNVPDSVVSLWFLQNFDRLTQPNEQQFPSAPMGMGAYMSTTPADPGPFCCDEDYCFCNGASKMYRGPIWNPKGHVEVDIK